MLLNRISLVSSVVEPSELAEVALALQVQVIRDFGPLWGIAATVSAVRTRAELPLGTWPIYVGKTRDGGSGFHFDRQRQLSPA